MKPIKVVKKEPENNMKIELGNIIVIEDGLEKREYLVIGLGSTQNITIVDLNDATAFVTTVYSLEEVIGVYFSEDEIIEVLEIEKIVAKPK